MKLAPTLSFGAALALASLASPALAEDWNTHFGGIPNAGLLTGELGYSSVPKVAYHHPLSSSLTMGGAFAFDLGYYSPNGGTNFGISLTAPVRISMSNSGAWSTALKLEPGFLFQFEGAFGFNILLNAGFNAGYRVSPQFTIGPGVDVLTGIRVTNGFAFVLPILMGGALEFHPTPELGITFDLKMGPWIYAGDFSGVNFGLKVAAGVAYHL